MQFLKRFTWSNGRDHLFTKGSWGREMGPLILEKSMLIREILRFGQIYRLLTVHTLFLKLYCWLYKGICLSLIFFNTGYCKLTHQEVDVCQICHNFIFQKRIAVIFHPTKSEENMIFYSICLFYLPYGLVGSSITSGPGPPPGPNSTLFRQSSPAGQISLRKWRFHQGLQLAVGKKPGAFNQEDEITGLG